jgi:cardiolipin synthase A/B
MIADLRDFIGQFLAESIGAEIFSIAGFLLAMFLVARLMSEKKAPANTFAWLLVIVLMPYAGVPLYLLFGGRKLRSIIALKKRLVPILPQPVASVSEFATTPVAQTVAAAGAGAPVSGNRLQLLPTGEDDFMELERQICAARHSIHITAFILGRDDTGRRIVGLLAQRAREGIKVRLLLDALGCLVSSHGFVQPIRDAGGEVGRFMPVLPFTSRSSANLRNHRKIAIFDHTTAIVGGRNLAREYMGPTPYKKRWRDFGAVLEGPAATLLNEVFIADWCFATRQSPDKLHDEIPAHVGQACGPSDLQIVASGPDVPGDPLYEGIVSMIQEAKRSICIVTPYFIPDDVLLRSLIVKARAGCTITLILPAKSNHPVTDFARRHYLRELQLAGARVLLFRPGMLHAKAVIVDHAIGLLGSPNFDLRSLFVNFEIGVFVHSPSDVAAMAAWADELAALCHESKPDRKRGHRLFGNIAEDLSRLLAPLL